MHSHRQKFTEDLLGAKFFGRQTVGTRMSKTVSLSPSDQSTSMLGPQCHATGRALGVLQQGNQKGPLSLGSAVRCRRQTSDE